MMFERRARCLTIVIRQGPHRVTNDSRIFSATTVETAP
jgi:hypothetical protein